MNRTPLNSYMIAQLGPTKFTGVISVSLGRGIAAAMYSTYQRVSDMLMAVELVHDGVELPTENGVCDPVTRDQSHRVRS